MAYLIRREINRILDRSESPSMPGPQGKRAMMHEGMPCAGSTGEEEVSQLAAEAGLNERAFAETLQSPDTTSLANSLAAACRCHIL